MQQSRPPLPRHGDKVFGWLASLQGIYFFVTGVWPLVDIESFMAVTGPKQDLWLVRTVGVLVTVIGAVLLLAGWRRKNVLEVFVLGMGGAVGLAAIDVVYTLLDVIPPIYLLDAVVELVLLACWGVVWIRRPPQ